MKSIFSHLVAGGSNIVREIKHYRGNRLEFSLQPGLPRKLGYAAVLGAVALTACSTPSTKVLDYQGTTTVKKTVLGTPPNLIDEAPTQRALPPAGGATSLSNYQQIVVPPQVGPQVLPPTPGIALQSDGTQRWLVVRDSSIEQLWPQLRKFWQEQGFLLVVDSRERGIMETDWKETHANIDLGFIRNTLSKAMNGMYTSGERNRYRTRIETGPGGNTLYIVISQKGLTEALSGPNNSSSEWVDRPNDPGLEATYLARLQQELALNDARTRGLSTVAIGAVPTDVPQSATQTAQAAAAASAAASAAAAAPAPAPALEPAAAVPAVASNTAIVPNADNAVLLQQPFNNSWQMVGAALDRANFTVDVRDPAKGIYFIRYADPNDLGVAGQTFWNQVFHGKKEKAVTAYLVNVRALTETSTRVAVVDEDGNVLQTRQAKTIMNLMAAQLR